MTNLDSMLKSRDITLSTKVRLVKAIRKKKKKKFLNNKLERLSPSNKIYCKTFIINKGHIDTVVENTPGELNKVV